MKEIKNDESLETVIHTPYIYKKCRAGLASKRAITLITLIITIVILIILAGVTISLTIGENSLFSNGKYAKIATEKEQLKEELEIELLNIKLEKLEIGQEMTREDVKKLSEIGANITSIEIPAEGEYKDYFFEIDENYEVTILDKVIGDKPTIDAEIITSGNVAKDEKIEIKVTAGITNGTINQIIAMNGAELKEDISNTEKIYTVTENGTYYFKAKADNGRSAVSKVEVNSITTKVITVSNTKVTLVNSNVEVDYYSQSIGTKLVISFETNFEGGEVISVTPSTSFANGFATYTTDGTETEIEFEIKGMDNETEIIKKQKISIKDKYYMVATSLVEGVANMSESSFAKIQVEGSTDGTTKETKVYNTDFINYKGDLVLDGITNVAGATLSNNVYEFGDASKDVATASTYAQNMVILKVDGNLTINEGVTLTACKSANNFGGPKGMLIYCTGTLTNNGTITMTARGAKAKGENVYLFKNDEDDTFEYVPATGASGGANYYLNGAATGSSNSYWVNGNNGSNGTARATGGGGSGSGHSHMYSATVGRGGNGTSYSGGSGSGAALDNGGSGGNAVSSAGSDEGGSGSSGAVKAGNASGYTITALGGTGNSSGGYAYYRGMAGNYVLRVGTGGLLVIYTETFNNNGVVSSNGVASSSASYANEGNMCDTFGGGASGGGSVNIFYQNITSKGTITATGGTGNVSGQRLKGGSGGNGSVSIGSILSGTYAEYSE